MQINKNNVKCNLEKCKFTKKECINKNGECIGCKNFNKFIK